MNVHCKHVRISSWYFDGDLVASDYYEFNSFDLKKLNMLTADVECYDDLHLKEAVMGKPISAEKDDDRFLRLEFYKKMGPRSKFEMSSMLYGSKDMLEFIYFDVMHLDEICGLRYAEEE